jgi:hypothetical protein
MATKAFGVLAAFAFSASALADTTIGYRIDGECAGDFDALQLKDHWLRADSHQGVDNSMIYDGAEKLAYFLDNQNRTFMQTEMDEDAIDLQADMMTSLGKKMRNETGMDPFEMARSLCPGMNENMRDRQPDEPVDCGNGTTLGGADGKPASNEQLAAAMKGGQMQGMDAESQQMMQKMMEQMAANLTPEQQAQMQGMMAQRGTAMPSMPGQKAAAAAPRPHRIDKDVGEMQVGDITCTRRQHLRGEEMLGEDCFAAVAALKLSDVEARRLARFAKSLQDWAHSMMPGRARPAADERVLIQRTCYRSGKESGHAALTMDHAPIAESRFEVPPGYVPLDVGQGMQRAQGRR